MIFKNKKNNLFINIFLYILFLNGFILMNTLAAKANIIDNIINLFTSSSSPKEEIKSSLSTSDLLKPNLISNIDDDKDNNINDNDLDIGEDGTIHVQSGPLRISTEKEKPINDSIILYEVKSGDSIDTVSKLFNVSKNTIVWANNLKNSKAKLTPGDSLLIFPITGIQYVAKSTISINEIAKKYNADAEEISQYNGISISVKLAKGDTVFIPDAEAEMETVSKTSNKNDKNKINTSLLAKKQPTYKNNAVTGYFMKPVSGCIETQGLHGPFHTAVDLGCHIGTTVVAAANGVIIKAASTGYNGGYGEVVIISHPNGTQTIYAHLSAVNVSVGQNVLQGQVIGASGNTGHSTGPHLHFETRGTGNPFA